MVLELRDALGTLAKGCRQAVGAGVTAAHDHHVEPLCVDLGGVQAVEHGLCGAREVIESKHDALCVGAGHVERAGLRGAHGHHHGVELGGNGGLCGAVELDLAAGLLEQLDAAHDGLLGQLHAGDAVHEKAAGPVCLLEDGDVVALLRELPGAGQARRARAHDGDAPAGLGAGRGRMNDAQLKGLLHDGVLVVPDAGGLVVQAQVAGLLAQRRAHAPGELGEGVAQRQALVGLFPQAAPCEVVPLGNEVVQGAARDALARPERHARLAEGNAARHATAGLGALLRLGVGDEDVVPVAQAGMNGPCGVLHAALSEKSTYLSHRSPS